MNERGEEYLKDVTKRWKEANIPHTFSDDQITERVMRLGREAKLFDLRVSLDVRDIDELRTIALATLRDDVLPMGIRPHEDTIKEGSGLLC